MTLEKRMAITRHQICWTSSWPFWFLHQEEVNIHCLQALWFMIFLLQQLCSLYHKGKKEGREGVMEEYFKNF